MGLDFEKPELGKPGWGQKVDANFEKVKNYTVGVDNAIATISNDLSNRANYNYIINGDFSIWQRGISFRNIFGYTADRYRPFNATTDIDRVSVKDVGVEGLDGYSQYATRAANVSGITYPQLGQIIEQATTYSLRGQIMTFSAYFRSYQKASQPLYIRILFHNGVDWAEIIQTTSISIIDNKWVRYSFTFKVPNAAEMLMLYAHLQAPSSNTGFYMTNVKLEIGDKATPFVPRLPAEELALCQRYCYLPIKGYKDYEIPVAAIYNDGTMFSIDIAHPVTMRVPPKLITNIPSNVTKGRLVTTYNGSIQLIHQITPDANIQYTYSCDESRSAFRIVESQKPFTQEQCNYQISYDTIGLNPDYFIGFDAEI